MRFLYCLVVWFYNLAAGIVSPFNAKAALWVKGRKKLLRKIETELAPHNGLAWFHCASVGEFEQGRPIIEAYKTHFPNHKVLITFFSPSGYELRKNYNGVDYVYYLPIDSRRNARQFLEIVKPNVVFFIKYEFWYFYLSELKKRNIPVYLASGIFRPNQIFFKWYGKWYRKMLRCFTHIFVQHNNSAILLRDIGLGNLSVSGDTRFDRVKTIAAQTRQITIAERFTAGNKVLIAGSTWPKDEEYLCQYMNQLGTKVKMVIAPHEISEEGIQRLIKSLKIPAVRFSKTNEEEVTNYNVLVIDNIGMLSSLYQYGTIAYVGGGFGKGIHNILEPATFGLPVIFGPNFKKFNEAHELVLLGGAFPVEGYAGLRSIIDSLRKDETLYKTACIVTKNYVEKNTGATTKIIDYCFPKKNADSEFVSIE